MIAQANSYRIPMADKSVHCIVTSPPYWGLRSYGLPPLVWGGSADCRHEWGDNLILDKRGAQLGKHTSPDARGCSNGQFCRHCSAWLGSFGLEPTVDLFVQHMVEIGREMRRVLRDDGTLWLNLGDSFATASNGRSAADTKAAGNDDRTFRDKPFSTVGNGLKAKDLCMVPARCALALQADGWWLRQDVIWHKLNPMPESVTDRPTTAHEHVFLLTKAERYFYDEDAVREPHGQNWIGRTIKTSKNNPDRNDNGKACETGNPAGRNLRSVWSLATEPFPGAHYATFPTKLVTTPIRAGSSERGVCPACGSPWERVVERVPARVTNPRPFSKAGNKDRNDTLRIYEEKESVTAGWRPTCNCPPAEPVPAIIFDPFCGSGTTGAVAHDLGRRFIGLDLSPVYLAYNALPRSEKKMVQAALKELPLFSNLI